MGADLAVVVVLSLIGLLGFAVSFEDATYLLAGIGGLVVGIGAAIAAHLLRLNALLTIGLAIVGYFLLGTAFAVPQQGILAVIPTIESLTSIVIGPVFGWADIVTLQAPVFLPDYVTAVPYSSAWLVGLVSGTLAVRWLPRKRRTPGRAALLLIGPVLLYLASVLLGTEEPYLAGARGVGFAALALVWLGWRHRTTDALPGGAARTLVLRKAAGIAIVTAGAVTVAAIVGTLLAPPEDDRFVLREEVEPPFVPVDFSSPLAGYREYTKLLVDTPLFTVTGLQPEQTMRIATMDSYDGVLWNVAGAQEQIDGSGSFSLVGRRIPDPPLLTAGETVSLEVRVSGYDDVWLPSLGYPTEISFKDEATQERVGDLRYNPATGTAALTSGVRQGVSYELEAVLQEVPGDDALEGVPTASVQLATVSTIPDVVAARATEYSADSASPIEQLRNIEVSLQTQGFLSHGTASDQVPSLAGHGADRMEDLFTRSQMIGDEEQYASAFALMARSLGYPARVVMGFAPDVPEDGGPIDVTGDDVTAWVEVPFEGVGWVPFYPTPEQTDVPQDQNPKPKTEPQPQVRQPPRTQTDQDDLISPVEIDDSDKDDEQPFELPGWVVALGLSVLIPATLLLLPMLVIALLKAARLRRRREAARGDIAVAGAWEELVDRYSELGIDVGSRTTRMRQAGELESRLERPAGLATLARSTDDAVFSGRDVPQAEAEKVWSEALVAVEAARESVSRLRRILSRYRLRAAQRWTHRVSTVAESAAKARRKDASGGGS